MIHEPFDGQEGQAHGRPAVNWQEAESIATAAHGVGELRMPGDNRGIGGECREGASTGGDRGLNGDPSTHDSVTVRVSVLERVPHNVQRYPCFGRACQRVRFDDDLHVGAQFVCRARPFSRASDLHPRDAVALLGDLDVHPIGFELIADEFTQTGPQLS